MVDAVQQEIGEEGFETELNAEGAILVFCLGQSADDEHGNIGGKGAKAGNELGAGHTGHEVVGNDEVNVGGEFVVAKLLECARGIENGDDEVTGSLKDGLTGRGLNGVVVYE